MGRNRQYIYQRHPRPPRIHVLPWCPPCSYVLATSLVQNRKKPHQWRRMVEISGGDNLPGVGRQTLFPSNKSKYRLSHWIFLTTLLYMSDFTHKHTHAVKYLRSLCVCVYSKLLVLACASRITHVTERPKYPFFIRFTKFSLTYLHGASIFLHFRSR